MPEMNSPGGIDAWREKLPPGFKVIKVFEGEKRGLPIKIVRVENADGKQFEYQIEGDRLYPM
ncbi:hypothetical protein ACFL67_03280 [candidate division KSB1 bacterium]